MTKTGKPDSYWAGVLSLYAQGKFKFTTGKKPGAKKWKAAMQRIDSCPLTPVFNQQFRERDIFGKIISCRCGFHRTSSSGVDSSSSSERPPADTAAQSSSSSGRPLADTASQISSCTTKRTLKCSLCSENIDAEHFTEHLSDFHAVQSCDQCGKKFSGAVELLLHIEEGHLPERSSVETDLLPYQPPPSPLQPPQLPPPSPLQRPSNLAQHMPPPPPTPPVTWSYFRPPEVNWVSFLPSQFLKVIKPADQEWIAKSLYEATGQLKQQFTQNWFYPPSPPKLTTAPPNPRMYFMRRMFLWAPMRMWGIPLKCQQCNTKMHHSGIYTKVREVIDIDSRYYLVGGDYPRCSKCMIPVCPWSSEVLNQLDPAHRNKFPAVLTTQLALDRRCVTLLKPRTAGNSSSYLQQALEEVHSEEWARRVIQYFSDCELHKKRCALTHAEEIVYEQPPSFNPLPLAQWFEAVHANEIVSHVNEMKGVITSTYGRILKLDSTKKITKKLAGDISNTATWMTNVSNECGQILNCVLTTAEGAGLDELCQGIVQRYQNAGEPEPDVIYVDRDCCSEKGEPPVRVLFRPWNTKVRLDIFHFMRRFTSGLTTEHHPLYGTFCSRLSSCIFEWDKDDIRCLKDAKRSELKRKHGGHPPTDTQVLSSISSKELAKHCRRRTRGVEETRSLIKNLLSSMWELTDTSGLRLINPDSMTHVWEVQQKHLPCIQDPPGVELYTKLGSGVQKGDKVLDVLRCGRGSSSVEGFHRHQCTFIPGWRCNAMHTQMYMLEGGSRWNINRAREAVQLRRTSHTKIYDVHLMCNLSSLSNRVLGHSILPEFIPPGIPTDERVAVEYLLAQSGRADMLQPQPHKDLSITPTDMQDEDEEDDYDVTMGNPSDILSGSQPEVFQNEDQPDVSSPASPVVDCESSTLHQSLVVPSDLDSTGNEATSGPFTSAEDSSCDTRGFPGWENVDKLTDYLVTLNRTITALSNREVNEIVQLYSLLHPMDKSVVTYTLKSKKKTLPGPWRASRKRSGSAPGQQAAERLFMTHGQVAQRPDTNRVSECVCIKLFKEYEQPRNRPKDSQGKTLPIPYAIIHTYSHIKQLLEDSPAIQSQTNLVLVTINTTTVSSWLHERQKRAGLDTLLQGVQLPPKISVGKESLGKARPLPSAPVEHGHLLMDFKEPENHQGEAVIRPRRANRTGTSQDCMPYPNQGPMPSTQQSQPLSAPWPPTPPASCSFTTAPPAQYDPNFTEPQSFMPPSPFGPWMYSSPYPYTGWFSQPPPQPPHQHPHLLPSSSAPAPSSAAASAAASSHQTADCSNRHRKWRLKKAAVEDQERAARGEPPKKRHNKDSYHYQCGTCGQSKNKNTGHTQVKGKWYCPASGQTITEWKETLGQ